VLSNDGQAAAELVHAHRALGAPFILVIENDMVTVWQVRSQGAPQAIETVPISDIADLFERNREAWHPDVIHRAKSLGLSPTPYQTDFIDLGLLPVIEGEMHIKLDRLLVESLNLAKAHGDTDTDPRSLFRVVFRLLAAKVLEDRRHPFAQQWQSDDLASVLAAIERYYGLITVNGDHHSDLIRQFDPAWAHLRAGISFSNISSDDLAFVYENTLITDETRDLFGTHSTPRQLAEYVVSRLGLHEHLPQDLKIYEPCAGAGVFLVSALRHLRDLLPDGWSDEARHAFLIQHIAGDEIDPFACEVATLSLILADYPNHNGWHIREVDLLADGALATRMASHNIILCNPPFEAFEPEEKTLYPEASAKITKAIAVLSAAIDVAPLALGFVLPRAFILEKQFAQQRRRLETMYSSIEIVELPDRIFGVSQVESSALIAKHLRTGSDADAQIVATVVADRDRQAFLTHGHVTEKRQTTKSLSELPQGDLWIPPLGELWTYLADHSQLRSRLRPRWGMRWNYPQEQAERDTPADGYRLGLLKVKGFRQYTGTRPTYLDFQLENLREGYDQPWSQPKLIMNAMRLRRGPWRAGAMVDLEGLLYSQQFFGLWPTRSMDTDDLFALCAVVNGPIASAFLSTHSPQERFRAAVVGRIPLPTTLPAELSRLVKKYYELTTSPDDIFEADAHLNALLKQIDDITLRAYDLPTHLIADLRRYFAEGSRPLSHSWSGAHDNLWHSAEPLNDDIAELGRVRRRFDRANHTIQQRFIEEFPTFGIDDAAVRKMGGPKRLLEWEAGQNIFSVMVGGERRYPRFQFGKTGPVPGVQSALHALPSGFTHWQRALWFVSANPWLDHQAPIDLLEHIDRLVDAAKHAAGEIIG